MRLLTIALLLVPTAAFAQLEITEIMYDAEGTDTNQEWVEIQNSSNNSIAIGEWYFYEGETHHRLTPDGFQNLAAGARAVIAQNIETISDKYPGIRLIKSSFSLNNTGESLALSNPEKEIVHTRSYSSDDGAAGNGFSLQRFSSGWIQADPTPGAANAQNGVEDDDTTETNTSTSSNNSKESTSSNSKIPASQKYYSGYLDVVSQSIARSPVMFDAHVTYTKGRKTTKQLGGGTYYINYGDGSSFESERRIDTHHIYEYPGEYIATFEFYSRRTKPEYGDAPEITLQKTIVVKEHSVEIVGIDARGSLTLKNTGSSPIDLYNWRITTGAQTYTFPRHSHLGGGKELSLPAKNHRLGILSNRDVITLQNDQRVAIDIFSSETNQKNVSSVNNTRYTGVASVASDDESSTQIEEYLEQHPGKEIVSFAPKSLHGSASVADASDSSTLPFSATAGIGAFAAAMVFGKIYARRNQSAENTSPVIGEIELIE